MEELQECNGVEVTRPEWFEKWPPLSYDWRTAAQPISLQLVFPWNYVKELSRHWFLEMSQARTKVNFWYLFAFKVSHEAQCR